VTSLLEVEHASVSYGPFRAVRDVSIHVDEHEIVGLIGPNGAGKTSLFNAISGLIRADHGSVIRFEDINISGLSPTRRARLGIGRSFQHLGLMMAETVSTNVMGAQFLTSRYRGWDVLFRPRRCRKVEERIYNHSLDLLAQFRLTPFLASPVSDLSFAGARFVELCGVLARGPKLVLLDEPTTGLSPDECDRLRDALVRIRTEEGLTVLVISHDVRFVMNTADRLYVLAAGSVLVEGTPEEVRSDPAVISTYLGTKALE
jgi:branched-chain amino acid transport system ATP-binding protein